MRFAEMVLRSLARRISSMIAEYDASTSGARRSMRKPMSAQYVLDVPSEHLPAMVVVLQCCDCEGRPKVGASPSECLHTCECSRILTQLGGSCSPWLCAWAGAGVKQCKGAKMLQRRTRVRKACRGLRVKWTLPVSHRGICPVRRGLELKTGERQHRAGRSKTAVPTRGLLAQQAIRRWRDSSR
jgi:hypothetical protein